MNKSEVDDIIASSIDAQPNDDGTWSWALLDKTKTADERLLRGSHETQAAAFQAGVGYVRLRRADIVRAAEQEAREGALYRSKQE